MVVPTSELQELASDRDVAPQKAGVLLKYTNVLKGWKRRAFTLENGVLVYSTPCDEVEGDGDEPSTHEHDKDKVKRIKHMKKRLLRRASSKDEKERDVKGSINLQFAVVSPDDSDDTRFAIDVGHDVYHCRAENRGERDSWVTALSGSKAYFHNLIQQALSRAKEDEKSAAMAKALSSTDHPGRDGEPKENGSLRPGVCLADASDESDDSFLEDDGLKEAEESRKALICELRRILSFWRGQWAENDNSATNNSHILHTISETFRDRKSSGEQYELPARGVASNLIDLVAWCLNVLETNDEMFDRRLKADLARMMGGVLPVFPTSPHDHFPLSLQASGAVEDGESEDEFFDALSRAASMRTSLAELGTWTEDSRLLEEVSPQKEEPKEDESQRKVERIRTSVISRPYAGSRTRLPILAAPKEKLNVFNLLKDNIGKDLSKISMPVTLNEPLSFLQKLAEDIEYCELLDEGAAEPNPERRMMYVATMIISHLSSTQGRISKPFNPLLGETFSLVRPDKGKGVRFVAEQVSHHPPVSACYAEGSSASWKYYNNIEIKNKFWGKSLEVFPTGPNHIEFPEYGDHYVFEQVTSCVHNIVVGRMWLDNYGEMEIVNRTNGGRCRVTFNKTGWMSDAKSFASIKAVIYDANGKAKIRLGGNWTKRVYEELPKGKKNVIWSVKERPSEDASQSYNLTKWAITLNQEVPEQERDHVAPTDSRFRPDQRALEHGKWELGNSLKQALEEGQRNRRKKMEEAGEKWEPVWFRKATDEGTGRTEFVYNGDYFEKQAALDWSKSPDLYSCAAAVNS